MYLIMSFAFYSCITNYKLEQELNMVNFCSDGWIYKELDSKIELKVLLFNKGATYDIYYSPNLIIGVTPDSNMVAIIDKEFDGVLKKDEIVSISPGRWPEEHRIIRPIAFAYKKHEINLLYCKVQTAYFGHINKK